MKQYLNLVEDILENGIEKDDRTGTGTVSVFGRQLNFNMLKGFPLLTTKKVFFKGVVHELLWFLKGSTDITYLKNNGVKIWDLWANNNNSIGPLYGKNWRKWENYTEAPNLINLTGNQEIVNHTTIDQITNVIDSIKNNPHSRRHVVSAWNVADLPIESISPQANVGLGKGALAPCHMMFQFYCEDDTVGNKYISLRWDQRSVDVCCGLPFNIASYALLLSMVAQVTQRVPKELIFQGGDCHIYKNHIDNAKVQLQREPLDLCKLQLNGYINDIDSFTYDDIKLVEYNHHGPLKFKVSK